MIGVQGILANNSNVVNGATVTASNVKAVANSVRRLSTLRQGNGLAALTGNYSGAADSIIDVEIVDEVATAPIISKPAFEGQGSGTLDAVTFTGAAQEFEVELSDLGDVLTTAAANLDSVKVVSRVAGAVGNAISLTVDESTLTFTATAYSLIEDLKLGTKATESSGFDWQSVVVGPDKVIPTSAKRVVFGTDHSNIYLQYKTYEKGNWVYNFEPAVRRDVPKGTPVFFVTGGRTITATDSVTPEVYTGIISLYDLLAAIQTASVLLKVEGVVANDRHPGGQGVKELNLRTDAFMAENSGSGSVYAKGFESVVVNANANTEIIEARCYANSPQQVAIAKLGSELWELRGSVSGLLDAALVTDALFTEADDKFALKIPQKLPLGFTGARGRFSVSGIAYISRAEEAVTPPICVVAMNLGPSAVDQQVTLRYVEKVSNACDCSSMSVPNTQTACLGFEGEESVSIITERLKTAYTYRKNYYLSIYDSAVPYAQTSEDVTAYLTTFETDFKLLIDLLHELSDTLEDALEPLEAWDALYADFTTEATAVLTAGFSVGGSSDTIEAVVVDTPIELSKSDITSIVVKDVTGITVPSSTYTIDLTYGVLTFTEELVGYVLPLNVEIVYNTAREKYYSSSNAIIGDTVPTNWVELPGVDLQNFRLYRNDGTLVTFPTEVSGLSASELYEIDQVNGRIRFIDPAYQFVLSTDRGSTSSISASCTGDIGDPGAIDGVDYDNHRVYFIVQVEPTETPLVSHTKDSVESDPSTSVLIDTVPRYYMIGGNSRLRVYIETDDLGIAGDSVHDIVSVTSTTSNGTTGGRAFIARYSVAVTGTPEPEPIELNSDDYEERRVSWPIWADSIRADAGKFEASGSVVVGDGCWRDYGDANFWEVTGSVGGVYQNAFNNRPYYSSKGNSSTKEFAFQINVKCVPDLMVGDTITLSIGDAGLPATYQVGDSLVLSTVAAQPLQLAGGVDGDNTQTWHVSGSVDGAFPAYPLVTTAPTAYSESGLDFIINPGAVAFDKGDKFTFTVEGGHWRWRKDGGVYSAAAAITLAPVALADGLSLTFTTGVTPSFKTSDIFSYRVTQPYNPQNVKRPTPLFWRWDGAGATLTMMLGATKTITALAMLHRLPAGAGVAISGGVGSYTWTETFTAVAGQNLLARFVNRTADRLSVVITSATDGAIDWLWAGAEFTTEYSAEVKWQRDYKLEHGAGFNPGAIYLGKAGSGEFKWDELTEADRIKMEALLDHVKQYGDEPMIFFPQRLRPSEAMLARIIPDQVDLEETFMYQPDEAAERHYSLTLPLQGVFL